MAKKGEIFPDMAAAERWKDENSPVRIGTSDIVTAFDDISIGSRVIWPEVFRANVKRAVLDFDWDSCDHPGQAYIVMPTGVPNGVLPGNAPHTHNLEDYVVRKHRGRVGLYLKRPSGWTKVDHLAIVVYELDAYINDPDVSQEEAERLFLEGATHVLVAVLASSGPASPLSPSMLVHNLAGGNNEALAWTGDQIREKAREIEAYQVHGMITVAD
jgi:hypothetical protein